MAKTGSDHHDHPTAKPVVGRRKRPSATSHRHVSAEPAPTHEKRRRGNGSSGATASSTLQAPTGFAPRETPAAGGRGDLTESELARLKETTLAVVDTVSREAPTTFTLPVQVRSREVPDYDGRGADEAFFKRVLVNSDRIGFPRVKAYLDAIMLDPAPSADGSHLRKELSRLRFFGGDTYRILKKAIEAYLLVAIDAKDVDTRIPPTTVQADTAAPLALDSGELGDPGLRELLGPHEGFIVRQLDQYAPRATGTEGTYFLRSKLTRSMFLELIWSYWMEEGMLVQTLNALTMRFQNRRVTGGTGAEALSRLEVGPLRALNPLLWSYIQAENERLSVVRRSHEYDHHYGLRLFGKALSTHETADPRSNFLRAFHQLLHTCTQLFHQFDDLNVMPDPEPVFRGLRELEMILGEGMHNQYGDLPWNARVEMIGQQWMLSLPEVDKFLGGRENAPYPEPWMDRVETMKGLLGWRDASVLHFRELALYGEQLLISIRFGDWIGSGTRNRAWLWAQTFRDPITRYLHAYRAVTGVDLADGATQVDATLPGMLLTNRRGAPQAR